MKIKFYNINFFFILILFSGLLCLFSILFISSSSSSLSSSSSNSSLNSSNNQNNNSNNQIDYLLSINSYIYKYLMELCISSISLSIPLLIDLILDINLSKYILLPRWMHIIGLIIPNIILYNTYSNYIWYCTFYSQIIFIYGGLLMNMFNDKKLFTIKRKQIYISFIIILSLYFQYNLTLIRCTHNCYTLNQIQPIINIFMICTIGVFITTILQMLWSTNFSFGEKDCVLYSFLVSFSLIVSVTFRILLMNQKNASSTAEILTLTATSMNILIAVISSILPSRRARKERDLAQVSLILFYLSF